MKEFIKIKNALLAGQISFIGILIFYMLIFFNPFSAEAQKKKKPAKGTIIPILYERESIEIQDYGIEHNTLTEKEKADGWELLFNGKDLSGWTAYRQKTIQSNWIANDNTLMCTGIGKGHIITLDKFKDFELKLEWKIESNGNSGIYFRVSEDTLRMHFNSIEMQVLDNKGTEYKVTPKNAAGACYGLYRTDMNAVKEVGEWNTVRILAEDKHVRFWLNDVKTADFIIGSQDWNMHLAKSKFKNIPKFAANESGHIGFQHHKNPVWYRAIKIRRL